MNAMTTALAKAGVQLPPLTQRIWMWIKDHPGCTSPTVAKAIKAKPSSVSGLVSDMAHRGMVVSKAPNTPPRLRRRGHAPNELWAIGAEWPGMLPYKTFPRKKAPKPAVVAAPAPVFTPAEPVRPTPAPVPQTIVVDNLTVGEARRLFAELNSFFKPD